MKFALDHCSLAELKQLVKSAERRLKEITKRRPIADVRRELTHFAATQGYAIDELLVSPTQDRPPVKRRKRKRPKVAPKYRDPDNPRNTWSGRGNQPRWLAEKVKRGRHATDFLIPGLARPTEKEVSPIGKRTVYKADAG